MLPVSVIDDAVHIGDNVRLILKRTVRVAENAKHKSGSLPLPDLGTIPVALASDFPQAFPENWEKSKSKNRMLFAPLWRSEAAWIHFESDCYTAIQAGTEKICGLTGHPWHPELRRRPHPNYFVIGGPGLYKHSCFSHYREGEKKKQLVPATTEDIFYRVRILEAIDPFREFTEVSPIYDSKGQEVEPAFARPDLAIPHRREGLTGPKAFDTALEGEVLITLIPAKTWKLITNHALPPATTKEIYNQVGYPWRAEYRG